MKKPIELRWPRHGISDDQSHGNQLPETTPHAKNVRTLDPKSGRAQGAQRPGYANFTSHALRPGKSVDAMASVAVDLPKVEYKGPSESDITKVWGHTVPGLRNALAVTVDREGNLYVLDAAGSFEKIGADGEVAATQAFYVPHGEAPVPRIEVDFAGTVYVATSHPEGYSSRVLRFARSQDEFADDTDDSVDSFTLSWSYAGLYAIRDFRQRGGVLAVGRQYSAQTEGGAHADVMMLGALFSPEPQELFEAVAPWPISTLAIDHQGSILGCSPRNEGRSFIIAGEGWTDPVESWSLHELEDVSGYGSARRLHCWIDAKTLLDTHLEGSVVEACPDRRWLQTSLDFDETDLISTSDGAYSGGGSEFYIGPTDTTARQITLVPAFNYKFQTRDGPYKEPVFSVRAAGASPAITFHGQGGTFAAPIRQTSTGWLTAQHGQKSDTNDNGSPNDDGVMSKQGGIIPHHERAVFTTFIVFRQPEDNGRPQCIWEHCTKEGLRMALIIGATKASLYTDTPVSSPGELCLFVGTPPQGSSGNPTAPFARAADDSGTGTTYQVLSCDLLSTEFDSPQKAVIACIQFAGDYDASNGPSTVAGRSLFRVNGRTVDRFTVVAPMKGKAIFDALGSTPAFPIGFQDLHSNNPSGYTGFTYGSGTHVRSWQGDLFEVVTVLGSTDDATKPNESPTTWPGSPSEPRDEGDPDQWTWIDETATPYSTDSEAYTNKASEIERIEGYLAYRWGCPNVLPSTTAASAVRDTSTDFQDTHPFGYFNTAASTELRPPVGSPAAGGVTLTPTGQALLSQKELLFKMSPGGKISWAIEGGGHGLGVEAGEKGAILTVGRHDAAAAKTVVAKRLLDLGSEVRETGENTWEVEHGDNPSAKSVPGLAVDGGLNLYWPREDEAYSFLMQIVATPTDGDTIFAVTPGYPTGSSVIDSYIFQTTLSVVSGATSVKIGASAEASAVNLVAAWNKSGDSSTYLVNPSLPGVNPTFRAAIASDASDTFIRFTRIGVEGDALFTRPSGNLSNYPLTEVPPSATYPVAHQLKIGGGKNRRVDVLSGESGGMLWSKTYLSSDSDLIPRAVALDPELPLYPDDSPLEGTPENVYVAQQNNVGADGSTAASPTGDNVQKLRQVERVQVIGKNRSPRKTVHTATCDGAFFVVSKGQPPRMVNNGHRVFNPASPFAKLWTYRQKVYGLDGQSYARFDPKTRLMEEWSAEGSGKIPFGAKLACVFAECIVLGRTADDPHNFHLSERGNPDGWDTDPTVLTPLSSFSGASTGNLNFRKHDLVNCLIPASDDLLIIGGDQSISRMSGHPGSGGQLDNISTSEGLAFGDAYCVGPGGTVFAKTMNGGILRISPNGTMDRISLRSIERRLQDVVLSQYDIRMVWNFRQEGLHVFQVPKGIGERIVEHWFWDSKENGWWADEFSSTGTQPTSVAAFDGDDPDDRVIAIGCEDGFVRYESELSLDDGGHRIESEIVFGPLVPDGAGRARFSHLEATLSSSSDPADVAVFTDAVSDVVAGRDAFYRGSAGPGYRGYNMFQASGNQAWVKLGNSAIGESFSLESLFLRAKVVGKRRRF